MNMQPLKPAAHPQLLIWGLTLLGLAIALLLAYLEHGRVNPDAVHYLEVARRFSVGDVSGAVSLYNWPLFPWLVAKLSQLTGLGLENAARSITIISFGIVTWSFLTLIREAGGSQRTLIAGAVLLFSAPYLIRSILPMIVRDQGFWAFYLLSLLFFLRFYQQQKWAHGLAWQLCIIVATLFRIEAVSLMVLLPLIVLVRRTFPWKARLNQFFQANTIPVFALLAILAVLAFSHDSRLQVALGRLPEMIGRLQDSYYQITVGLHEKARIFGSEVLRSPLAGFAMLGLCATLAIVVVAKVIGASGWLSIFLLAFDRKNSVPAPSKDARIVMLSAAAINLLNLLVILLSVFLLSGRYALGLAFIILFFAAFRLQEFYETWLKRRQQSRLIRWVFPLFALLLLVSLLNNLIVTNPTRNYEQDAVAWAKQQAPQNARFYYETARLRYYANAPWAGLEDDWRNNAPQLAHDPQQYYDYLLLSIGRDEAEELSRLTEEFPQFVMLKEFKSKRGDRVVVLKSKSGL